MAVKADIMKAMGIKPDEKTNISLFILYSFALGLATAFFFTPATSLFLREFSRQQLPAGYILGGFFVFLVGRVVKKTQKRRSITALVKRLLAFLLLSTGAIVIGYFLIPSLSKVFVFAFFAWIRLYLYILGLGFWGLANRMFNIRQGKRIFSLILAGEVISYIISFFSIPFILRIPGVETPHLLFLSLIGLVGTFLISSLLMSKNSEILQKKSAKKTAAQETSIVQEKPSKKYFRLLYTMASLPILAVIFVEFLFYAQSQEVFKGQDETLSGFLAIFFGLAAVVEFSMKTFVSGRLLDRLGLKFGLIALPGMLGISFLIVSLSGFIPLIYGLFFPALALSRLFLRAFRASFYEPTFQVLFQSIPEADRLGFQNMIESSVKSYGNILSGILLLLLMYLDFMELEYVAYIFFGVVIVWVWVTLKMYGAYHSNLNHLLFSTSRKSKNQEEEKTKEHANETELEFWLYFLKEVDFKAFEKELINAFPRQKGKNRERLKEWLIENFDRQYFEKLKDKFTAEETDQFIIMLETSLNYWEATGKSGSGKEQVLAANMLASSKRYMAYKQLLLLMHSENTHVLKAAYRASGKLQRSEIWPFLFEGLKQTPTALVSIDSIFRQRETIIDPLVEFLQKNQISSWVLRLLIPHLVKHPTDAVVRYLQTLRSESDYRLRNVVLHELATLETEVSKRDRTQLFISLEKEVNDIVRFAHVYLDLPEELYADIKSQLLNDINQKRENIFLLLSVMYDSNIVKMVWDLLERQSGEAKGFAVEILDMTVEEDVKLLVLPVMENETPHEITTKYRTTHPLESRKAFERLREIANIGYFKISRKTRLLTLRAIGEYFPKEGEVLLKATATHPNQIFRRLAGAFLTDDPSLRTKEMFFFKSTFWLSNIAPFKSFIFDDLVDMLERSTLCQGKKKLDYRDIILIVLQGNCTIEGLELHAGEYIFIEATHPYLLDSGDATVLVLPCYEFFFLLKSMPSAVFEWKAKSKIVYVENGSVGVTKSNFSYR